MHRSSANCPTTDEARLLQRPWFERAWVDQELASAQIATCYCGRRYISWHGFALIIQVIGTCHTRMIHINRKLYESGAFDRAWSLTEIRKVYRQRGSIKLFTLLHRNRHRLCQDPRDKVYSILGLTDEHNRVAIKADYNKSVAIVYAMAMRCDIESLGNLHALALVDHQTAVMKFPSWVADLGLLRRRLDSTNFVRVTSHMGEQGADYELCGGEGFGVT